jgi:hypothetical protein
MIINYVCLQSNPLVRVRTLSDVKAVCTANSGGRFLQKLITVIPYAFGLLQAPPAWLHGVALGQLYSSVPRRVARVVDSLPASFGAHPCCCLPSNVWPDARLLAGAQGHQADYAARNFARRNAPYIGRLISCHAQPRFLTFVNARPRYTD